MAGPNVYLGRRSRHGRERAVCCTANRSGTPFVLLIVQIVAFDGRIKPCYRASSTAQPMRDTWMVK